MTIRNINDVQVGMITADKVMSQGRVILGPGVEITEKTLRVFKSWGVSEVDIEGEGASDVVATQSALTDEDKKKIEDEMTILFAKVDMKNEVMEEIYRIGFKKKADVCLSKKSDA